MCVWGACECVWGGCMCVSVCGVRELREFGKENISHNTRHYLRHQCKHFQLQSQDYI